MPQEISIDRCALIFKATMNDIIFMLKPRNKIFVKVCKVLKIFRMNFQEVEFEDNLNR